MEEMFKIAFMHKALIVSTVIGALFSYIGVYIVLRRTVFVGIALSQLAACGFAFGLLVGIAPFIWSLIFTLAGVILFSLQLKEHKITRESIIGFTYAFTSSLAIIFIAKAEHGEANILEVLSGNIFTITDGQLFFTTAVFFGAGILHALFYQRFILLAFDAETASAGGIKTGIWNFVFYLILGITISLGIQTAGVLLVFSYLVIPAMTALLIARNMSKTFITSVLVGVIATVAGVYLSFALDLPGGTTIVTVSGLFFMAAYLTRAVLGK
ncbi:MAG: metal ABC transporter permease [bacterium]|nr:metal ABC transporter permease [bacterium]MDD5756745.1 metal ABC transporter permease [bacterium]